LLLVLFMKVLVPNFDALGFLEYHVKRMYVRERTTFLTPFFLVLERIIPSLFFSFSLFISRYFWNREKRGGQGSVDSLGLQRNLDVWKNLSLVGFGVCSDQFSVYSWARTCKLLAGVSRGDTFYDPLV
jgi:hypothetical protein